MTRRLKTSIKVDVKRLRADANRIRLLRLSDDSSVRRGATGSMALLRTLLPEIERLRKRGTTWNEIAKALAKQGVVQALGNDLVPITGRRVSAILASLRRQEVQRRDADVNRAHRRDLCFEATTEESRRDPSSRPLKLSDDLTRHNGAASPPNLISEEALRRAALADVKSILLKGKPS